jgi:hypothetical protein
MKVQNSLKHPILVRGEVLISPHEVWEGSYTCKVGYLVARQHGITKHLLN